MTGVLFVLLVIQSFLAFLGSVPVVAGLHGLNALIMIGLAGYLTSSNWAFRRRGEVAATAP